MSSPSADASQVTVAMIAAVAANGVIGRDNTLPWHLPGDLQFFKTTTLGKPIVMGRRTFESIGRPLPGRLNIVVTRDPEWRAKGVEVAPDSDTALQRALDVAAQEGVDEVMVIGGAGLYAALLPRAQRLYLTRVHAEVAGDTYFPPVDWSQWQELSREDCSAGGGNPFDYSFVVYQRCR